jgi:homoserine dehydrogenase
VRFPHGENVSISDFGRTQSGYAANGQQYRIGQADFSKLKEWSQNENIGIILAPGATFQSVKQVIAKVLQSA